MKKGIFIAIIIALIIVGIIIFGINKSDVGKDGEESQQNIAGDVEYANLQTDNDIFNAIDESLTFLD